MKKRKKSTSNKNYWEKKYPVIDLEFLNELGDLVEIISIQLGEYPLLPTSEKRRDFGEKIIASVDNLRYGIIYLVVDDEEEN